MSNYSDFFGVGSSGGGGGVPINGYTPFLVTTTGNPTGYDATTGLYTHPDGTYWVQTGFTILDTSGAYPSATGTPGATGTWASVGNYNSGGTTINGNAYGAWSDGTDYYIMTGNTGANTRAFKRFDSTFTFIDETSAGATANYLTVGLTGDVSQNLMWSLKQSNNVVTEWNYPARTPTGNTYTLPGGTAMSGFYYDTSTSKFYSIDSAPNFTIRRYDSSFNLEKTLNPTFPTTGFAYGMTSYPGSSYLYVNNNNVIYAYDISLDNPVSTLVSNITGGSLEQGIWMDSGEIVSANRFNDIKQSNPFTSGKSVGDLTARTDTDTTQPLFIRVG